MNSSVTIDSLLKPVQGFGVHLGLDRIKELLGHLGNPHCQVPIIHVTGTNGKGSVCAYLSSILTAAGYRVGRYTSPHLVSWTERICLNEHPIPETVLVELLQRINQIVTDWTDKPTQFEMITAAAWLYFAEVRVDLAVVEVGLGGRLDATNVCDRPLATVITSIAKDHTQHLGSTLAAIAREKAGILKPHCPAILGIFPPEAAKVIKTTAVTLQCPEIWVKPALPLAKATDTLPWAIAGDIAYPLPLPGQVQLLNSALAIATLTTLRQQGWQIPIEAIQQGMAKTHWLGRMQWVNWQNRKILVDGAHNPAAAMALRQYVDSLQQPVTWVMGMLSTKDHQGILQALLRESEILYLLPVPDHSSAVPENLASLAQDICPSLSNCHVSSNLFTALTQAIEDSSRLIVVCGSLYLIGSLFQGMPHQFGKNSYN